MLLAGCDYFGAGQQSYATPDEAVAALVEATKSGDTDGMLRVLGADAQPLLESGDAIADANGREIFVEHYTARNELAEEGPDRAILLIGDDQWPFPFPLVKEGSGWRFDTSDGFGEIIDRRIGRNELYAILACLAYVDAQTEYYASNPENDSVLHYARKLVSTPGRKDGLYWEAASGEPQSPLGPGFARARREGYQQADAPRPEPFYGYYYRQLESQGPDAIDGAYNYVIDERLTGGFALVAYPAERGSTGVMTFIVNQDGVVYSKDLGENTAELAEQITAFNPDASWKREDGPEGAP
jgi:hypothetical protein